MSNPEDERDIPTDAASYSLNIDPTVNGQLAGITNDKALKLTGFDNNVVLTDWDQGSNHQTQNSAQQYQAPGEFSG